MLLKQLSLQHFRSYSHAVLDLNPKTTIVIGPNTAGKTNLIEAIWLLATGKSFRIEKDVQMIQFGEDITRVKCQIANVKYQMPNEKNQEEEIETLEVMLANGNTTGGRFVKRYMVNEIPKRRVDFAGRLPAVLFSPEELDIVSAGPSLRRKFLHDVLEQVDREYRHASVSYEKALRQRNALLQLAKETGKRRTDQFDYWDALLIANGQMITQKRGEVVAFINQQKKDIFNLRVEYGKSTISEERLHQYHEAESGAGVTLVGPHRDDVLLYHDEKEIKYFGSRGQQRLAVLQLKLLELQYIEQMLQQKPLLLLDDIFSELDAKHMEVVLSIIDQQQTVMTTTHREFINEKNLQDAAMIELR